MRFIVVFQETGKSDEAGNEKEKEVDEEELYREEMKQHYQNQGVMVATELPETEGLESMVSGLYIYAFNFTLFLLFYLILVYLLSLLQPLFRFCDTLASFCRCIVICQFSSLCHPPLIWTNKFDYLYRIYFCFLPREFSLSIFKPLSTSFHFLYMCTSVICSCLVIFFINLFAQVTCQILKHILFIFGHCF